MDIDNTVGGVAIESTPLLADVIAKAIAVRTIVSKVTANH